MTDFGRLERKTIEGSRRRERGREEWGPGELSRTKREDYARGKTSRWNKGGKLCVQSEWRRDL